MDGITSRKDPKHAHLEKYILLNAQPCERTWLWCFYAVSINGLELDFVPDKVKIKLICSAAVGQNGMALAFVPIDKRDKYICKKALMQNKEAAEYVPTHILNELIDENWKMLEYVPTRFQNHTLLLNCVKKLLNVPIDQFV